MKERSKRVCRRNRPVPTPWGYTNPVPEASIPSASGLVVKFIVAIKQGSMSPAFDSRLAQIFCASFGLRKEVHFCCVRCLVLCSIVLVLLCYTI